MYTITEENVDFILRDLHARGIATESLRLNLLDHLCIIIEENLNAGDDFERFYAATIHTFYHRELRELEKETNYLLYKKNSTMKKAMIISGICSAVGFIGGSLGKIFLFRITDFLLFLGFISFVLLFLPLVFFVLFKEFKSKTNLVVYSSGILSLMLYFVCMLMKCLEWPSSNLQLGLDRLNDFWLLMWLTCLAVASLLFVPAYFLSGIRKPETKTATIITSILLVAFIGVQFRLTNLKPIRSSASQHASVTSQSFAGNYSSDPASAKK